jgi:hypothetical protein
MELSLCMILTILTIAVGWSEVQHTSHVPIFSDEAGKLDAFSLSCVADPAGAEHLSIFPLLQNPGSITSQLEASDADLLSANCIAIRSNNEGVFLRVKPRGLGSSKGSQGALEGTDTRTGGSIWPIFLINECCESMDLYGVGSPIPLSWSRIAKEEDVAASCMGWFCKKKKKTMDQWTRFYLFLYRTQHSSTHSCNRNQLHVEVNML